ncbi:MAG TPA: glutaredoxin family protein [Limnochordia bacterium]
MDPLIVYTKRQCCLCVEGLRTVRRVARRRGVGVEVIEIDGRAELEAAWGEIVPAVVHRGELVSAGVISQFRLERYLDGRGIAPRYQEFLTRLGRLRRAASARTQSVRPVPPDDERT